MSPDSEGLGAAVEAGVGSSFIYPELVIIQYKDQTSLNGRLQGYTFFCGLNNNNYIVISTCCHEKM